MRHFLPLILVLLSGCASTSQIERNTTYTRSIQNLKENERIEIASYSSGCFGGGGTLLVFDGSQPGHVDVYQLDFPLVVPANPFEEVKEEKTSIRSYRDAKDAFLGTSKITPKQISGFDRLIQAYRNKWEFGIGTFRFEFAVRHYAYDALISDEYFFQYMPDEVHELEERLMKGIQPVGAGQPDNPPVKL